MSEEKHRCECCETVEGTKPFKLTNCANNEVAKIWLCKEHAKKIKELE
jgi:hypothetical protein